MYDAWFIEHLKTAINNEIKNEYYSQNFDNLKIEDEQKMKTTSKLKMNSKKRRLF